MGVWGVMWRGFVWWDLCKLKSNVGDYFGEGL